MMSKYFRRPKSVRLQIKLFSFYLALYGFSGFVFWLIVSIFDGFPVAYVFLAAGFMAVANTNSCHFQETISCHEIFERSLLDSILGGADSKTSLSQAIDEAMKFPYSTWDVQELRDALIAGTHLPEYLFNKAT